ncbi:MAG: circularly permuted type 2 ATP-grasp protein [Micropepsaceae bacterium]
MDSYKPLAGVADELVDASGSVRPVWRKFIDHFQRLPADEITLRFARGDQYLRDAGVYFRQYGKAGSAERDWPLSHIPVLIHENEWKQISEGLVQRAELLESVVADLYGPNRLVAEGHLPPSLIGMSKEWLRPLVGVHPRSGHYLSFIAFEIGRGPDGNWWVLGDRTQAPSGAGFALENRIATARVFSEFYPAANVYRLAGFFQTFRDALRGLRGSTEDQVAILTPGLWNDTYFEHAYIARYLGLMLLEGEDLTVEKGRVMVRTVAGLAPVSVLWSRLDASYADPLELDERSRLGTPGIVDAIRRANLTMVNALGSGVLETRALLAFLPRIQALKGEPLKLSNIATWWCGQETEREHVRANIKRMMVGPALSTRPPFEPDGRTVLGGRFEQETLQTVDSYLDTDGAMLVGQEAVTLSTTPAFVNGELVPRPMSIRVFLARTSNGWQVMPGGYARIGRTEDATAIAMQRGGSVADVWVVSDFPVEAVTMLPPDGATYRRSESGVLPSRAADNLYWLGRYVERAEDIMRLLRAYHMRLAETANSNAPLLRLLEDHLQTFDVLDMEECVPESLRATIASAIHSASQVRDRFSIDGWSALNDLAKTARQMVDTARPGDDAARAMSVLLRKITGFSGLVHENMYRSVGWRFLSMGRSLERALTMTSALEKFLDSKAPEGALDLAVEIGDSSMTHRSRYAVASNRKTVIDLLALDAQNPRSVLYHLAELREHAEQLATVLAKHQLSVFSHTVRVAHADLAAGSPETLDSAGLQTLGQSIETLSDVLSSEYLT